MTVTLTCEVTVATPDLRDALKAVTPHARQTTSDDPEDLARVRLMLDKHHVNVLAANGTTGALAIVSIEDDSRRERFAVDDGPVVIDVTPRQVALILQQFKSKRTDRDGADRLRLTVLGDGEGLEVTDVSGLFAGERIRFPHVGVSDNFPDVLGAITRAVANANQPGADRKPLTAAGETLALFEAASKAYEQPVVIEPTGTPESRGFLVSCGESFLGVLSSRHQDDDSLMKRDAYRRGWLHRLGLAPKPILADA